MRPDRYLHRTGPKFCEPLGRDPQLRLRTAPEQIRRRGRDHEEVGGKRLDLLLHLFHGELVGLRVHQQRLMSSGFDLVKCKQQLQGIVGFLAAEVSRAVKSPGWIDEREPHYAGSCIASSDGANTSDSACTLPKSCWFA